MNRGEVRRAILAACLFGATLRCAPAPATPVAPLSEPRWQDALDARPDLLVVIRPQAFELDAVYGPILRRAVAVAKQRYRIVSETRALDAVENSDEVIVAVRSSPSGPELVFVDRGVRADVDPARIVDADGRALWLPGPTGAVRELERNPDPPGAAPETADASLFELPGRTWVIATGAARMRARQVFLHPTRRPAPEVDPGALFVARIDGPSLVSRVPPLRPGGGLDAIGQGLAWAAFELPPGSAMAAGDGPSAKAAAEGLAGADPGAAPTRTWRATLSYVDARSAAAAEAKARDVVGAFARTKPEGLAWLGEATVARDSSGTGSEVVLTAPLPAALIERLLHVSGALTSRVPL